MNMVNLLQFGSPRTQIQYFKAALLWSWYLILYIYTHINQIIFNFNSIYVDNWYTYKIMLMLNLLILFGVVRHKHVHSHIYHSEFLLSVVKHVTDLVQISTVFMFCRNLLHYVIELLKGNSNDRDGRLNGFYSK